MAVYEALLLNTVVPQIQAAQAGDSYVMVVNATTPALRITQTGTGDSILVEDAANPDSSPFVVTAAGDVGIGTSSPATKTEISGASGLSTGTGTTIALRLSDTSTDGGANTWNTTQQFTAVQFYSADTSGVGATIRASIGATMETANGSGSALTFFTNSSGTPAERMRLDASGNLGLGVTPSAWASAYRSLDMRTNGAGFAASDDAAIVSVNAYNNSGWKFKGASIYRSSRYEQFDGTHAWHIGNTGTAGNAITFTQAMTLDASGNLLVGQTSNGAIQASRFVLGLKGASDVFIGFSTNTGDNRGYLYHDNANFSVWNSANGYLNFSTNNTERARITSGGDFRVKGAGTAGSTEAFQVSGSAPADAARLDSSGNFLVGTTTAYGRVVGSGVSAPGMVGITDTVSIESIGAWNTATSGDNTFVNFGTEAAFTLRGSITYNRAGGLVAYNTTSDYRAKDIFGPVTDTGATIDALKVYNGKMKGATVERPMLIAHEAQTVTPYAVTGEKDAVDEDGKPKYQQMDVSSLVPLLIAEIQSLRARVAQLEAK
jgi:hypothetical protein